MRHRFVLSFLLLVPAVCVAVGTPTTPKKNPVVGRRAQPKSDDDVSINSLEDVDLSCDGAKCDGDHDGGSDSNTTSSWTTTKKPNIFQLTSKSCPVFELPPIFRRQMCDTDRDCWPRICCGYGGLNGQKYCRIPLPSWRNDLLKTITKSLRSNRPPFLQCSPPPPKRYDLFPRKCRTTVDCLPDLCCPEENGKNICRPAMRSINVLLLPFAGSLSSVAAAPLPPSDANSSSRRPIRSSST